MGETAIKVEGLGKEYIIGHQKSGDLRNSFNEKLKLVFHKNTAKESFWALKDIDFEIKKGEAVGIIGRNGAGKSTLLKILSRITDPTKGRFEINGRVSSLLEVGTGFHMELTGRENIYLNGTILGMKRREIKAKFDEIVAFSGVEKFIDTPVKHYSSGMKVRLAFSVAAHLEPEILIVDEVLAVGDAEFQKKCLGKMDEVSKNEGRTVLFVSHNMGAINNLCNKSLYLDQGKVAYQGMTIDIIKKYEKRTEETLSIAIDKRVDRQGLGNAMIKKLTISGESYKIKTGDSCFIKCNYNTFSESKVTKFGLSIWSDADIRLISISSDLTCNFIDIPKQGEVVCEIPKFPLVKGQYYLNFSLASKQGLEDYIVHALKFDVENGDFFGTGRNVHPNWGAIAVNNKWKIEVDDSK